MELDQLLFKKFINLFKKKKSTLTKDEAERTVLLDDIRGTLTILARTVTGKPLEILTAEREGGLKGKYIFLPEKFYYLKNKDLNIKYYQYRVLYLATAYNILTANTNLDFGNIEPNDKKDNLITGKLINEYPLIEIIRDKLKSELEDYFASKNLTIDYSWLLGNIRSDHSKEMDAKTLDDSFDDKALPKSDTVIKAKPIEEIETIQIEKKGQEDWVLTHNFEKVETIEEYSGLPRDFDGSDSLEDDMEALSEVNMRNTIRVDEETHSIYQAEFVSNALIADSKESGTAEAHYLYDEYNFKTGTYRKDYCKVFHRLIKESDLEYYRNTISGNGIVLRNIRKQFANFYNKRMEIKRVENGEVLNIDALTDLISDIYSGHTPNEKIYNSKRKKQKDISILFLLDQSLSSDGYSAGNKIIDVEKQIAILMGEVLNEYEIEFQVDGFSSKTRNNCNYNTVKHFDRNWNKSKGNIASLMPGGYTRMGPALRHANYLLNQREARSKWIVFLTDGKPNDYDKYEGKYGIADVKQALREIHQSFNHIHAFAIEQNAKYYLPLMFGVKNYDVLSNPKEMIMAITNFVQRIINA